MNPIPLTPETEAVSRRVIWFEEPEQALSDPVRFIAYAMTYATHEDMTIIRRYVRMMDSGKPLIKPRPALSTGVHGPTGIPSSGGIQPRHCQSGILDKICRALLSRMMRTGGHHGGVNELDQFNLID